MPTTAAKTPARTAKVGRKPNGSLEEMDKDCQRQANQVTEKVLDPIDGSECQEASSSKGSDEARFGQEASSSKRPAEARPGIAKKAKKKAMDSEKSDESSYGESDSDETDMSSEENSESSEDESSDEEPVKRKNGFIDFKRNPLITVDNRCNLRRILKLFKDQGSLMDRIDKYGKIKHRENFDLVAENLRFVEELLKALKNEVPNDNKLKKKTVKQVKTLKHCLKELYRDLNPASDTPQWGYHLLDWSNSDELIAVIGKSLARRVRTALKGQRKSNKTLFSKSPQEVSLTWASRADRSRSSDNRGGKRSQGAPFQPRNGGAKKWQGKDNNKFNNFPRK